MMKRTLLFILFISVSCLCFSQENAEQLIKKAENKIAEYDYKQALSLCDKALQLDPKSSHAMLTVVKSCCCSSPVKKIFTTIACYRS